MEILTFIPSVRRLLAVGFISIFCAGSALAQQGPISGESGGGDAIARFLMNFGRFIDWPETAFTGADSDLNVCVLGENQLGRSLDQIINGKRAGDRTMTVKELPGSDVAGAKTCHIVWVSASESGRAGEVTTALEGTNTLTVSEIDRFPESGGMIGLAGERGDKIAIRMNRAKIESAGLNVREQLMRAIQ